MEIYGSVRNLIATLNQFCEFMAGSFLQKSTPDPSDHKIQLHEDQQFSSWK